MALDSYFREVGKYPLLTKDQEYELAARIRKGCQRSREKLIQHNLRLAISQANKFKKTPCEYEDLVMEANVGLCKAVDKFDHTKGFRFSTYATWWIRQALLRYISRHSVVKFSSGTTSKIIAIRKAERDYMAEFDVKPTDAELCELTGFDPIELGQLRQAALWPVNLDQPMYSDNEARTLSDTIADTTEELPSATDYKMIVELLREKLQELTPQEERVIRLRFGIASKPLNTPIPTNEQ
jgi:RNA polymerase primary sigma factor